MSTRTFRHFCLLMGVKYILFLPPKIVVRKTKPIVVKIISNLIKTISNII